MIPYLTSSNNDGRCLILVCQSIRKRGDLQIPQITFNVNVFLTIFRRFQIFFFLNLNPSRTIYPRKRDDIYSAGFLAALTAKSAVPANINQTPHKIQYYYHASRGKTGTYGGFCARPGIQNPYYRGVGSCFRFVFFRLFRRRHTRAT